MITTVTKPLHKVPTKGYTQKFLHNVLYHEYSPSWVVQSNPFSFQLATNSEFTGH